MELVDDDDEPIFGVESFLSATMDVLPGLKDFDPCAGSDLYDARASVSAVLLDEWMQRHPALEDKGAKLVCSLSCIVNPGQTASVQVAGRLSAVMREAASTGTGSGRQVCLLERA